MAAAASDLDDLQVFGGGAASSHPDPEAEHGASSAQPASGKRAKYNDYLGSIADRDPADVDMFSIRRNFENIGLDLSMPDVKIDWREEVTETIHLVERFLLDATSSLRRIMEALRSYDEGNMTMDVKFASSTESRTIERALREPAHAVKGAAATVTFDRVALAFRAIELPLKDAVGRTEAEVVPEATRRARIDATLGPGRHLIRIAWLRLREAIEFVHDDLLAHVLEHRCGISDVEEAQMYIPTQDELDDGEPMPEGEPDDYNQEDWADDIADVAEDIEELGDKLPRDHVELELADFELPPGDGSE